MASAGHVASRLPAGPLSELRGRSPGLGSTLQLLLRTSQEALGLSQTPSLCHPGRRDGTVRSMDGLSDRPSPPDSVLSLTPLACPTRPSSHRPCPQVLTSPWDGPQARLLEGPSRTSQEWRGRAFRTEEQHLQRPQGKPAPGLLVWIGVLVHRPTPHARATGSNRGFSHMPPSGGQRAMACAHVWPQTLLTA